MNSIIERINALGLEDFEEELVIKKEIEKLSQDEKNKANQELNLRKRSLELKRRQDELERYIKENLKESERLEKLIKKASIESGMNVFVWDESNKMHAGKFMGITILEEREVVIVLQKQLSGKDDDFLYLGGIRVIKIVTEQLLAEYMADMFDKFDKLKGHPSFSMLSCIS